MHFTGTIWRPPYEADSLLLEATAGCTHHRCKFCTLYDDLPFKFRMSPLEDIERDLQEAQLWNTDPFASMAARLQGLSNRGQPLCAEGIAPAGYCRAYPRIYPRCQDYRLLCQGDRYIREVGQRAHSAGWGRV